MSRIEAIASLKCLPGAVHCYVLTFLDHASHVCYMRTSRRHKIVSERPEASPQVVVVTPNLRCRMKNWRVTDENCNVYGRQYRRDYTRVAVDSVDMDDAFGTSVRTETPSWHAAPGLASSPMFSLDSQRLHAATLPLILCSVTAFWRLCPRLLDLGGAHVSQSDLERICNTMRSLQHLCMNVHFLENLEPLRKLPLLHTLCMYRYNNATFVNKQTEEMWPPTTDNADDLTDFRYLNGLTGPKGLELVGAQTSTLVFPLLMLPFVTQHAPRTVTRLDAFLREPVRQQWGTGHDFSRFPQLETLRITASEPFHLAMLRNLALACPRLATFKCALDITGHFMTDDTPVAHFPSLTNADFGGGGYDERAAAFIEAPRLTSLTISDPASITVPIAFPAVPFTHRYPLLTSFALYYTLEFFADRAVDRRAYTLLSAIVMSTPQMSSLELARADSRGRRHGFGGIGNINCDGINDVSDLTFLRDTSSLKRLVLRGLAGEVCLPMLSRLTYLDVRGCSWIALNAMRCVPQLEILCAYLSRSDMLQARHPFQPLFALPHLHTLYILMPLAATTNLTMTTPSMSIRSTRPSDVKDSQLTRFIAHVMTTHVNVIAHVMTTPVDANPSCDVGVVSRTCVDKLVCWCYSDAPDVVRFTTRFACSCDTCVPATVYPPSSLPSTTLTASRCRIYASICLCAVAVLVVIVWGT
jgi:hypothetical protein